MPSPIEDWDVSQIEQMDHLFHQKTECNPDISRWNVSSVKTFVSDDITLVFLINIIDSAYSYYAKE